MQRAALAHHEAKVVVKMKKAKPERLVDAYSQADVRGRINIIMANYSNFEIMVNGMEESLIYLIISDRRSACSRASDELGIRVQTSGNGDTTASEAMTRVRLVRAFRSGNMEAELRNMDCADAYRREAQTIRDMREDYDLLKAQIKMLPFYEYRILDSYLKRTSSLVQMADEFKTSYSSVKDTLYRAKKRVKESAELYLQRKYAIG